MMLQDFSKSWHSMNICTAVYYSACTTIQTFCYRYASCHMAGTGFFWTTMQPKYHLIKREMKTTIHYLLSCSLQLQLSDESLWVSCHRRNWQNSTWVSEMVAESVRKLLRPQQKETPPGPPGCSGCCKTSIYCILPCSKSQRPPSQCYQVMPSSGEQGYLKCHL